MRFNTLIPELRVTSLSKSKDFYVNTLGFEIAYDREDFAMVVLGDCQIMLQQLTLPSSDGSWNVSEEMVYPFGRGINLQIILNDIFPIYNKIKEKNYNIFIDIIKSDYKEYEHIYHVAEFLVQDPDGYLLRFQQDIVQ